MAHCMRHYEEPSVADCRTCGRPYCSRCVVYSFGPNQAPFCVGCALTASGVRNHGKKVPVHAAPPQPAAIDKRVLRAQRKAEKAQQKMLKAAMKGGSGPMPFPPPPPTLRTSEVPAPPGMTLPSSRFASHGSDRAVS